MSSVPFSLPMSFHFPSNPIDPIDPIDPISSRKRDILEFAKKLFQETSDFLDHRSEIQRTEPRLPSFFLKSFNLLKKKTKELNYEDRYLDFIPNGIRMQLLTEYGPNNEFPIINDEGLLVPSRTETLHEEIAQFYMDILEYVKNTHIVTGRIPDLPHAYFLTLLHFQERAGTDNEDRRMVSQIPGNMQVYLSGFIGNFIPKDYVAGCTIRHYTERIRLF